MPTSQRVGHPKLPLRAKSAPPEAVSGHRPPFRRMAFPNGGKREFGEFFVLGWLYVGAPDRVGTGAAPTPQRKLRQTARTVSLKHKETIVLFQRSWPRQRILVSMPVGLGRNWQKRRLVWPRIAARESWPAALRIWASPKQPFTHCARQRRPNARAARRTSVCASSPSTPESGAPVTKNEKQLRASGNPGPAGAGAR